MSIEFRIGGVTPTEYLYETLLRMYHKPGTDRYIKNKKTGRLTVPNVGKAYEDEIKAEVDRVDSSLSMSGEKLLLPTSLRHYLRWQLLRKAFGKTFIRIVVRKRPLRINVHHPYFKERHARSSILTRIAERGAADQDMARLESDIGRFELFLGISLPDLTKKISTVRDDLRKLA